MRKFNYYTVTEAQESGQIQAKQVKMLNIPADVSERGSLFLFT